MDKRIARQGYTLLEVLVVLVIVSIVISFASGINIPDLNYVEPISAHQIEAIYTMKRVNVLNGLWFNFNGNVNHAQTVLISGKICTIQLGFGRYRCE